MSAPCTLAPGFTAADDALLAAVADGLSAQPFAARVDVLGLRISRPVARALEQQLLRARKESLSDCAKEHNRASGTNAACGVMPPAGAWPERLGS